MKRLTYLGHSAFCIEKDADAVLIDPFITGARNTEFDFRKKKICAVIVTHAHFDHLGDALEISKFSKAPIIAVFELANYCRLKGAEAIGLGIGGKLEFKWGALKLLSAVHSSSNPELPYGGLAAGVLLDIDGTVIYHAGDTALMPDFTMIGELYNPYYALLPIGGRYTMDIEDAALAAKMLFSPEIIPMHYNTFPEIKADVKKFAALIEEQGQKCLPLKVNEYAEF